jgi:hypothetical protein
LKQQSCAWRFAGVGFGINQKEEDLFRPVGKVQELKGNGAYLSPRLGTASLSIGQKAQQMEGEPAVSRPGVHPKPGLSKRHSSKAQYLACLCAACRQAIFPV